MPYPSNSSLPPTVQRALPAHGQTIWRNTFNSAIETYNGDEGKAASAAWSAVSRHYEKIDGKWVRKNGRSEAMTYEKHFEAIQFTASRIDREKRMVFGVSLLGPVSRNGYEFAESAMREAVPLFADARIYVNHQLGYLRENGSKNARDLAGRVVNPRFEGAGTEARIRGDLALKKGQNADLIMDDAESDPSLTGFSIHHESALSRNNGTVKVSKINKVFAVEYVPEPATTDGMFEAVRDKSDESEVGEMKWDEVTIETLRENVPELVESIVSDARGDKDKDAKIKELTESNSKTAAELAQIKAEKAEREHADLIESVLKDSKLSDGAKDALKPALKNCKDADEMKSLVESISENIITKSQEPKPDGGASYSDVLGKVA